MPGLFTQLLELQTGPLDPVARPRRRRVRLRIPGTLALWALGVGTVWAVLVVVLAFAVRY